MEKAKREREKKNDVANLPGCIGRKDMYLN
jgi:hypothetical protein